MCQGFTTARQGLWKGPFLALPRLPIHKEHQQRQSTGDRSPERALTCHRVVCQQFGHQSQWSLSSAQKFVLLCLASLLPWEWREGRHLPCHACVATRVTTTCRRCRDRSTCTLQTQDSSLPDPTVNQLHMDTATTTLRGYSPFRWAQSTPWTGRPSQLSATVLTMENTCASERWQSVWEQTTSSASEGATSRKRPQTSCELGSSATFTTHTPPRTRSRSSCARLVSK